MKTKPLTAEQLMELRDARGGGDGPWVFLGVAMLVIVALGVLATWAMLDEEKGKPKAG